MFVFVGRFGGLARPCCAVGWASVLTSTGLRRTQFRGEGGIEETGLCTDVCGGLDPQGR